LLLGVVAYFLRQLHTDFKQMERDLMEVKATTKLIKSEFKSGFDLLTQRVEFLEKRVDMLERHDQGG
jgi:chaperonin cofactor prefoldin